MLLHLQEGLINGVEDQISYTLCSSFISGSFIEDGRNYNRRGVINFLNKPADPIYIEFNHL